MIDLWDTLPVNQNRKYKTRPVDKIDKIVVHSIVAENWTPKKLNALCTGKPYGIIAQPRNEPTCSYHDYIRKDGCVYHMVDYYVKTWHAGNHNSRSIGVSLEYLPSSGLLPPSEQFYSLYTHLTQLCQLFEIDPLHIFGHRELEGTGWYLRNGEKIQRKTCPGSLIDMENIRQTVNSMMYDTYIESVMGEIFDRNLYWEA